MSWLAETAGEIERHGAVVRVTVVRADGSTPREVGAAMLVGAETVRGTIGGGALELAAIAHARAMLRTGHSVPSPLVGEGQGGGDSRKSMFGIPPAPNPSPSCRRHASGMGGGEPAWRSCRGRSAVSPTPGAARRDTPQWRRDVRDFPLGPSLGQCCGGYVRLLFEVFTDRESNHLRALAHRCDGAQALLLRPLDGGFPLCAAVDRKEHRPEWPLGVTRAVREMLSGARPREPQLVRGAKGEPAWFVEPLARHLHRLYLYGAGHVGRAVVRVLEDLPFSIAWVDTSPARFPESIPPYAKAEIAPDPAAFARGAEADAFHLVLTYSHALDLAICHSLLGRGDFRFLGLIGSGTKRARFEKRLAELGIRRARLGRLVCPIGLPSLPGKEPAMIALSVAAQLVQLATAAEAGADGRPASMKDGAR